jgi:hypothetical protein
MGESEIGDVLATVEIEEDFERELRFTRGSEESRLADGGETTISGEE